ncbi:RNA polymerase sigma factor SigJ [Streptomyces sp. NPDC050560]|uniref:RNA polymerase sigma factor SigJ n=1 Tax=Streptomyces sp. NPDC050560 TaxID=3365630 RepID=UPI00379B8E91
MREDTSTGRDTAKPVLDEATESFVRHRELLFSLAYNLLGTVSDTEDVLQETWLSWASAPRRDIVNPRAYLVRIAVNEAVSRLRRVQRSRERYVGPWLPEPLATEVATAEERALRAESVSLALLVVLETLTPLERVVFVLREAFGYAHAEIAAILGRSPSAVRQLARRARAHVEARRPRFDPDPAARRAATERFLAATVNGDIERLMNVLAPDVRLWSDGGGRLRAALRVIEGREKVVRLLTALRANPPGTLDIPRLDIRYVEINGGPAAAVFSGATLYAALAVDLTAPTPRTKRGEGPVAAIYGMVNPDKLTPLARSLAHGRGEAPG